MTPVTLDSIKKAGIEDGWTDGLLRYLVFFHFTEFTKQFLI